MAEKALINDQAAFVQLSLFFLVSAVLHSIAVDHALYLLIR